jgi:hypothetical protein
MSRERGRGILFRSDCDPGGVAVTRGRREFYMSPAKTDGDEPVSGNHMSDATGDAAFGGEARQ